MNHWTYSASSRNMVCPLFEPRDAFSPLKIMVWLLNEGAAAMSGGLSFPCCNLGNTTQDNDSIQIDLQWCCLHCLQIADGLGLNHSSVPNLA